MLLDPLHDPRHLPRPLPSRPLHRRAMRRGQHPEGVGRMAGQVVQRPVAEHLALLVVAGAVLPQEVEALAAADAVEPAARQDRADGGDAVLNRELVPAPSLVVRGSALLRLGRRQGVAAALHG